jgi:fructokinase
MALLGVETGGTKILARVIGDGGAVLGEGRWPTTTPDAAAEAILGCVAEAGAAITAAGMAAFGPLIVHPDAPDYGRMLDTPKPGWTDSNLRATLAERLGCPVAVDTDVNVAAIAEQALGAGRGFASVAYVTVGTGIGGGLAIEGHALSGALHSEVGHIRLARSPGDTAPSGCPFHDNCAEGLVAGPALHHRLGDAATLADAPALVPLVAHYLGQLMATLVLAWSPHRIVLGGGVMSNEGLVGAIAVEMRAALGGYGVGPRAEAADFLVHAALENAGLEGALLMARKLAADARG